MESRTFRLFLCALAACIAVTLLTVPAAADGPNSGIGTWSRPVPGRVAAPFVAPVSRYGPGHRGADLVAAPGTPVLAVGAGQVTFAGSVAGTLHVTVDHGGGLRTTLSFLATVGVRTGQAVSRGQVIGTAGGTGPDHAAGWCTSRCASATAMWIRWGSSCRWISPTSCDSRRSVGSPRTPATSHRGWRPVTWRTRAAPPERDPWSR